MMLKYSEYRMSKQHEMLKLASNPRNVAQVEPFIEQVFKSYEINPDMYGNILITLTEAVTNAIIHGNEKDETKLVRIIMQRQQKYLAFRISDEGGGFDYESLPDPTSPENILKIGGRGVFLMKQLSDDVLFHDNGSTVEIQFNL